MPAGCRYWAVTTVAIVFLEATPAFATCKAGEVPDSSPGCTPGVVATTDVNEICRKVNGLTYSAQHRATTPAEKRKAFAKYGMAVPDRTCWEIDHRCELSIGCADAEDNLWPQPGACAVPTPVWTYEMKDDLETYLYRAVCHPNASHPRMTPAQAQAVLLPPNDWRAGYCKYIGGAPCQ